MTILSFLGIFAGLGLSGGSYVSAGLLVVGVFSGSALWWFFLSGLVSIFRNGFDAGRMRQVNMISGTIIFAFGVLAMLSLIQFAGLN